MGVAHAGARSDDGLSALAAACVLDDVGPGCVVWMLGEGEEELAEGLAAQGAELRRVAAEPALQAAGQSAGLLVLGEAPVTVTSAALGQAHGAGCPFVYTRRQPACDAARRWYWCHQVPTATARAPSLGETWAQAAGRGALQRQNRYGHWVGWRRMVPAGQGSPGPVPAPPLAS